MPNLSYPQGSMAAQMGVWGVANTSRGSRIAGTDGRVFYVQPNSTLAVDNGNTGEDSECPFITIAAALAQCVNNRGDTILVGSNDAWQYGGGSAWNTPITEDVTVTVEGVTILGISPDPLGVPWQPATDGGTCLTITALGVEVGGFCFQDPDWGAARGIYCEWDGTATFGENARIHHCFFDGSLDEAIQLEYSWNNLIEDCQFQETDYGIYSDPGGSGFSYCIIRRCIFRDVATGAISALGGCDENLVKDCQVWNANAQGAAAAANEGFNFTGGDDNVVENCSFSCLLPVPANGDWDDLNTAGATDAWINNHCMDGLAVTNPT